MPGTRLARLASDARLVALVREGRAGAFDAIYDRHSRGILSFCRHMLGDQHEAEDAVQQTFMSAYSSLLSSQKPIHLRPWLFAIARNRCYSILRSQRERPVAELEESTTDGLAAEVQRRQDLRDLVGDVNRLPEEQRAAIILAELESLSHAEIADVLGVPRDKVKALVFQARESLLASRTARDTACDEIRAELAVGRGGALRRGNLRRHLRDCESCRAYRAQVQHQRRQFALLLPVAPTILAKEGLLAAALGAGGAAAVGGSGLIATGALKTGILKGVAAAVIAGVGTLGTVVVSAGDLPIHSVATGSVSGRPHAAPVRHVHHAAAATGGAAAAVSHGAASSTTGVASSRPASVSRTHSSSATRHHRRAAAERRRDAARHHHGGAAAGARHPSATSAPARQPSVLSGTATQPGHVPPGQAKKLGLTGHSHSTAAGPVWPQVHVGHTASTTPVSPAARPHGHGALGLHGHGHANGQPAVAPTHGHAAWKQWSNGRGNSALPAAGPSHGHGKGHAHGHR